MRALWKKEGLEDLSARAAATLRLATRGIAEIRVVSGNALGARQEVEVMTDGIAAKRVALGAGKVASGMHGRRGEGSYVSWDENLFQFLWAF